MSTVVVYTSVRGCVVSDYYFKCIMCMLEVVVVDTYSALMLPLVEVLQLRCVVIVLCTIWALAHGNCLRKSKKLRRFRIGLRCGIEKSVFSFPTGYTNVHHVYVGSRCG